MNILGFSLQQLILLVLVLFRVSSIMLFAPFFSSTSIPVKVKIALALVITIVIYPGVLTAMQAANAVVPVTISGFTVAVLNEIAVGIIIGFVASLVFVGLQLAGQLIGQQVGLALANVLNPQFEEQMSLFGEFFFFLGIVIFLIINGHYVILESLTNSYSTIPVLGLSFNQHLVMNIAKMTGSVFIIGLKIAAPVLIAMFLVTVSMGFIARTVPQMNILVIGFPVRVMIGIIVTVGVLAPLAGLFLRVIDEMLRNVSRILVLM